jgi:hypothetical protein
MATTAHQLAPLADPAADSLVDPYDDADNTRTVELPAFVFPMALRTTEVTVPEGDSLESIIDNELYLRECEDSDR